MKKIALHHFKAVPSTNQILYHRAEDTYSSWDVVTAEQQSQGKGYAGNHWESAPGKNLLFSFLLKNDWEVTRDLPYLNKWVAAVLTEHLTKWQDVKLKWPNDLILNKKKLGGVLIENKLIGSKTKFTVIGIGLNVNQTQFREPKAISLKTQIGEELDLHQLLKDIMQAFQQNFYLMEERRFQQIDEMYHRYLFKKDKVAVFQSGNDNFNGIIRQVNEAGDLVLEKEDESLYKFKHKEITLLF